MSIRTSPPPPPPPPPPSCDLEVTIISGKHLKNVNWKNGFLKPYAIFWVDPDHKLTTKSDDSGHTKPVWNQRFLLPLTFPLQDSSFSLEVFHSKASEAPKPFVGSLHISLFNLHDPNNLTLVRSFDLLRPSGRPQGKIRLKLAIKDRPLPQNYHNAPLNSYYYSSAPPYPVGSVGYYAAGYYSSPPPPPPPAVTQSRAFSERYGAPSAPVDYAQSRVGGSFGVGTGVAIGAVAGGIGGLALDEGLRREEVRMGERGEESVGGRDDYSDYRGEY